MRFAIANTSTPGALPLHSLSTPPDDTTGHLREEGS
jgi:hypothetical protein